MKKKLLVAFISIFLLLKNSTAQVDTSTVQKLLQYIMQPLDKNQIPTGFLEEYGCPMLPMATFNGTLTDSNRIDMNLWRTLYFQLQTGWTRTSSNPLPAITTVNTAIQNASGSTVLIPLLIGSYNTVKSTAFSSNLLSYNGSTRQVHDVPNRPQSPYNTNDLFAACPLNNHTVSGTETFVFNSNTIWNNTGKTISSLQVDFADGDGFQSVNIGTPITINYTDTGYKRWTIKATLSDNSILQCYNDYYVLRASSGSSRYDGNAGVVPAWGNVGAVNGVHSGAEVRVIYSNRSRTNTLRRPLIVVEGFDASGLIRLAPANTIADFVDGLSASEPGFNFNNNLDDVAGYDLVFINFNDGTDDIVRNAAVVEEVINRVNTNKVNDDRFGNTRQENVVIGLSMGGLCARFALADMTRNLTPTETRLLITHDAPHRGANVPLGLQYLILMMGNAELFNTGIRDIFPDYDDAINLLNEPATQQLVLYRATGTNTFANNVFLDATYRPMVTFAPTDPQPTYRFIATANGNECAHPLLNPGQAFIDLGAGVSAGIYARLLFFRIPIVTYKLAVEVEARALPNSGSTNKIARLYTINNLKLFGFINIIRELYNNTAYAPGNHIPVDGAPGSTVPMLDAQALSELTSSIPTFGASLYFSFPIGPFLGGYFGIYAYNNGIKPFFTFVPVASALDVTPYSSAALSAQYVNGTNQAFPSSAETFIAQETVPNSPFISNNSHLQFTPRNAQWLYNEMENLNNNLNCSNECFNPYFIQGDEAVCGSGSGTYIIPGLPRGATVTWSVSPSWIANLSCTNCISTTLTRVFDGRVTLTATITNSCASGTVQITKDITVGVPVIEFASFTNAVGGQGYWCSTHTGNLFSVEPPYLNNATFEARLLNYPSMTVFRTNSFANVGTDPFSYVPSGWYIFQIRTSNVCGTSNWYETEVEYVDCFEYGRGGEGFRITVSPNPVDGDLNITIDEEKADVKTLSKTEKVTYQLYNMNRTTLIRQWVFDNSQNRRNLNARGLMDGQYVLVVTKGKYRQSTKIIIK